MGRGAPARPRARRGARPTTSHRGGRLPDADRRRRRACRSSSARRARTGAGITVRGTPGHASQPFRTDNALVTAAEVVQRLAEYRPPTQIHETWRRFVEGVDFGPEWNANAARRGRLAEFCEELPIGLARQAARLHAHHVRARRSCTAAPRPTSSPTASSSRSTSARCPASAAPTSQAMLDEALGDLARSRRDHAVRRERVDRRRRPTRRCGTRWSGSSPTARRRLGAGAVPHRRRHRRPVLPPRGLGRVRLRAVQPRSSPFDDYASMFHGNDERVDIESLVLSTRLWDGLARDILG